jgi:Raf kinase inhibitor-like YbhB/YbcL family protein
MGIVVETPAFAPGGTIPRPHTGDGEDLSPALAWAGLPPGTAELALVVDDPDAPVAEPWVHWMVYAVPGNQSRLPGGFHGTLVPPGMAGLRQGRNSWGTIGYRGPAPPRGHGVHHYRFTLYAVDRVLDLPSGLDRHELDRRLEGRVLGTGQLVGLYQRPPKD